MKKSHLSNKPISLLIIAILFLSINNAKGQSFCTTSSEQITGEQDGYRHELWNQNSQGTACMTLGSGCTFSGEYDGILNYLARRGLGYDQTQEHEDIGTFYSIYNCDYNPSGNSYLSVYGWTVEPLIEFYIVEDWRNWIPSMAEEAQHRGTISVNGSVYDIIENTRVEQPSILGTQTFQQYFSIRRDTRNSGIINISDHFEKWESLGLEMGNLHEVSFVVEGYQSSGSFEFTELDVFIDDGTGIEAKETQNSSSPKIYPNPNNGNLMIEVNEAIQNYSVRIFDTLGKTVYTLEQVNERKLLISDLKRGIYFVHVSMNNQNYLDKVLVQ